MDFNNTNIDSGTTHKVAEANRQSKKNKAIPVTRMVIAAAKSCGMLCEKVCSRCAQSSKMVDVRSERLRSPQKESGNLRNFSASLIRRCALTRYIDVNILAYCQRLKINIIPIATIAMIM